MRLTIGMMSLDPTLHEVGARAASPTFGCLRDGLPERAPRGAGVCAMALAGRSPVMLHCPPEHQPGPNPSPPPPELADLSAPRTPPERRTR